MRPDPSSEDRPRAPPTAEQPALGPDDGSTVPSDDEESVTLLRPPEGAPTPTAPLPPKQPDQLPAPFGRYQLVQLLGRGGMGTVYLAQDSQLDRPVALKVPHFSAEDGPLVLERFRREARAAATLRHANLCPVYDVGAIDGTPYLTMAYIEGRSLAEVLRDHPGPVKPRQAAALVRRLALALAEAHRLNVVHRDLKPANVMLTGRGEPIIMDFGLARRGDAREARMTLPGARLGTPAYMAPEQARGDVAQVGPACDVYSLGVILYELLAGRPPFTGDSFAVLSQLVTEDAPPPSRHRPGLDPTIEAICLKAMARKAADRYLSMADFAVALAEYLKHTERAPAAGASPTPPGAELPFVDAAPAPPATPAPPPPRKRRWAAWSAAALVLLGGAALLYRIASPKAVDGEQPESTAPPAAAPGDGPVEYVWPADWLRDGKVRAPDLGQVRPLFQDRFEGPASGFPRGPGPWGDRGYRNRRYFIEVPGRRVAFARVPLRRAKPAPPGEDFACQVVGRARGRQARWGLSLFDRDGPGDDGRINVSIGNPGRLRLGSGGKTLLGVPDVTHPVIKMGPNVANTLLVVLRGRQLETYVNEVAVSDPVLLEHAYPSPRLALLGAGATPQGGTAEFESITLWPAESIPPLAQRGAVPKR
jgi:serine/threonine protein kinase